MDYIQRNNKKIFVTNKTDELNKIDGGFDIIICNDVLEHVNNPRQLLNTIHDLLDPKGLIYISLPIFNEKEVDEKENLFRENLNHPKIKEIRGKGLMLSIEFKDEKLSEKVVNQSLENGLLLFYFLFTKTAIRITPPLTISKEEIIKGCEIIKKQLSP